eukprot:TRINITY_DN48070_c0_g1_i1.p1 TRINITY_DN48070_c0_g1~~TRINITY_DN48070_c0_g1_i1.p1  ORF type:complete len:352 (+),score=74.82 TRINITY_DN48070_c0_g1_i1:53-1057(+)
MGSGAASMMSQGLVCYKDWLELMAASTAIAAAPCCLVACVTHQSKLSERVISASAAWYELLEYDKQSVENRAFSEIRGLQGPLTSDWSKLQLASLLLTKERLVENIKVVNYTGRSRRPLELCLSVQVFQWQAANAVFQVTVQGAQEVLPQLHRQPGPPMEEWQAWLADVRAHVRRRTQPCLLVLTQQASMREVVDTGNEVWLNLCEFSETEICGKEFSQIPGFQGPLTTEGSKLQLAALMLSQQREVTGLRVVNYAGRSRQAMEVQQSVVIFKHGNKNVAFLSTVQRVTLPSSSVASEPEPEDQVLFPAISDEEASELRDLEARCAMLGAREAP